VFVRVIELKGKRVDGLDSIQRCFFRVSRVPIFLLRNLNINGTVDCIEIEMFACSMVFWGSDGKL
jgi:hypothetical protein